MTPAEIDRLEALLAQWDKSGTSDIIGGGLEAIRNELCTSKNVRALISALRTPQGEKDASDKAAGVLEDHIERLKAEKDAAVAAEREACAKVADGTVYQERFRFWSFWQGSGENGNLHTLSPQTVLADKIAAAIRSRATPPAPEPTSKCPTCGDTMVRDEITGQERCSFSGPAHTHGEDAPQPAPQSKEEGFVQHIRLLEADNTKLRAELHRRYERETDQIWYWQKDGGNALESLTCQVIIRAQDLRDLLSPQPRDAQPVAWQVFDGTADHMLVDTVTDPHAVKGYEAHGDYYTCPLYTIPLDTRAVVRLLVDALTETRKLADERDAPEGSAAYAVLCQAAAALSDPRVTAIVAEAAGLSTREPGR